jgi:hypothetical protein
VSCGFVFVNANFSQRVGNLDTGSILLPQQLKAFSDSGRLPQRGNTVHPQHHHGALLFLDGRARSLWCSAGHAGMASLRASSRTNVLVWVRSLENCAVWVL